MRGVVKQFNQGTEAEITVLHGCDLQVRPGEFVSVVGSSGSGKTTLMNIIGLLDRPTEGTYHLDGIDVLAADDDKLAGYRSQKIGFIFQNFNLIGRIDAQKNVELPMMYAGVPAADRRARAAALLEEVGMADRADHLPSELSGGQKQRVAVARALANQPALLLADEPTGALDSVTGRSVMDLFHRLHRERAMTIVFITHNPDLAAETERTVTMVDGLLDGGEVPTR